jgi:hypothetical protein
MTDDSASTNPEEASEFLLYQTEDGNTRVQVRMLDETVWLSQRLLAELFQKDVRTINEHIQNIFEEGELERDSVIRKFRITAADGKRYNVEHYNLDIIISVGYRVRSHRGTQFRQWATQRLREFIIKGFVLDDERLKAGRSGTDYFDELLTRIRDIRSSERRFYQIVRRTPGAAAQDNDHGGVENETGRLSRAQRPGYSQSCGQSYGDRGPGGCCP